MFICPCLFVYFFNFLLRSVLTTAYEVNNQETVSFNRLSCGKLIYFYYKLFDGAKQESMYGIKLRWLSPQILSFLSFSNSIKETSIHKRWYDIDDNENLDDVPRLGVINEKCDDFKIVLWLEFFNKDVEYFEWVREAWFFLWTGSK